MLTFQPGFNQKLGWNDPFVTAYVLNDSFSRISKVCIWMDMIRDYFTLYKHLDGKETCHRLSQRKNWQMMMRDRPIEKQTIVRRLNNLTVYSTCYKKLDFLEFNSNYCQLERAASSTACLVRLPSLWVAGENPHRFDPLIATPRGLRSFLFWPDCSLLSVHLG